MFYGSSIETTTQGSFRYLDQFAIGERTEYYMFANIVRLRISQSQCNSYSMDCWWP